MGCIHEDRMDGKCSLCDSIVGMLGCDENGHCVVSEDPDPGYSCESYESDWECPECGMDLNVEECECEED